MNQILGKATQANLYIKCLQLILSKEDNEQSKSKLQTVIKKIQKNPDNNRQLKRSLEDEHHKFFQFLLNGFKAFHESYHDLIKLPKNEVYRSNGFDVTNYLVNIQEKIHIEKKHVNNVDQIIVKYIKQILNLKRATQHRVTEEFIVQWKEKAKEKLDKFQKAALETVNKQANKQNFKALNEQQSSQQNDSEVEQVATVAVKVQPKQRLGQKRKIQPTKHQIKPQMQQTTKQSKRSRQQMMQKYLEQRKDLTIEKGKSRQVAQHLLSKLLLFMNYTLDQLIDIAALKSKKNNKFANQIQYFSPSEKKFMPELSFHLHSLSSIYTLGYKHRLQIYSNLRMKEFKKEEQIRSGLEAKTNEMQKRIDKKIQSYILKPYPKEIENFVTFKEPKEMLTTKIGIHTEHLIYYLQNHIFLRNSHLYFSACHS